MEASRFVYLGPEGTFAEQALRTLADAERGTRTPARSVPEALDAVRADEADAALVPLENSIGGAVGITLDELATGEPLVISREVVLPVEFVLACAKSVASASARSAGLRSGPGQGARSPAALESIRTIAAHPQAAAQCRRWLRAHVPDATVVDALSNAAAAADVAAGSYDAAISAPIGTSRHGLTVLADKIADHPEAVTRFALVTRPGPPPPITGDDLTSLAVYISHDRVGALLAVLMELSVRGINLTRIESRPTGERLGRYAFFLDCAGHVAEARVGEALQGLRRICADVRFLGSYPRHHPPGATEPPAPPPPGLSDPDFADAADWLTRIRAGRG